MRIEQQRVETADFQWRILRAGESTSARTLICLHGFLGTAEDWIPLIEGIAEHTRCVAVDLPGHGETQGVFEHFSWQQIMASLRQLVEQCAAPQTFVLGYSMGGRLALGLAAAAPALVHGVIVESASPGIEDDWERLQRWQHDLEVALDLMLQDFETFLEQWYRQPVFAALRHHPEFAKLLQQRYGHNEQLQLAAALKVMSVARQPSYWQWLRTATLPLLFIAGEADEKYRGIAERLAALGNAHLEVALVPKVGHMVHFEAPEVFRSLVEKFLSKFQQATSVR